jgi:hypothetical protein
MISKAWVNACSHNILNHSEWSTYDEDINKCSVIDKRLMMGPVYLTWQILSIIICESSKLSTLCMSQQQREGLQTFRAFQQTKTLAQLCRARAKNHTSAWGALLFSNEFKERNLRIIGTSLVPQRFKVCLCILPTTPNTLTLCRSSTLTASTTNVRQ